VTTRQLDQQVSREDDDEVLACALAAKLVVSGDDDLLFLKSFSDIPICHSRSGH
jgi:uncharacterized protein